MKRTLVVLALLFTPLAVLPSTKGASTAPSFVRAGFLCEPQIFMHHTPERCFIGPGMIQLANGDILMAAPWGRPPTNFEQLAAKFPVPMLYRSHDGGRTWQEQGRMKMDWSLPGMISDGGVSFLRMQDGRLAFLAHRHVQGLHGGGLPVISFSKDDGATWTPARLVGEPEGVWYVMNDRLIQTRRGRLVVPVAHMPQGAGTYEGDKNLGLCFFSDDAGSTWRRSRVPAKLDDKRGMAEPCVAEVDGGRLLILARTGSGFHYASWSDDGGDSWSKPEPTTLASACAPLTLKTLPDGRLIVFYDHAAPLNAGAFFPRTPLCYAVSGDGGRHWGPPVIIDDEGVEHHDLQNIYPAIAFTKEGMLVLWSTHRADPAGSFAGAADAQTGGAKRAILKYPQKAPCVAQSLPWTADLEQVALRENFDTLAAWSAQPTWQSNPSRAASATCADGVACFAVPEPKRGMKWSRLTPGVVLEEMRYLVVRYRAENVRAEGSDYFIHLDDGGKTSCTALRLDDVVADGQWHTVAVDATRLGTTGEIKTLAIQVPSSAAGQARLWLDWVMFADRVPEGATELRAPPQLPDRTLPLAAAQWRAHGSWLANPATQHEERREGEATVLSVGEPGRGMKWAWELPQREPLGPHRFLTLHYRATNCAPVGDYALSLLGKPRTGGRADVPVVANREIIADGRWHTLSAGLTVAAAQLSDFGTLALQVQAGAQGQAVFQVDRLALTSCRAPHALAEFFDLTADAHFDGFQVVDLSSLGNNSAARFVQRYNLAGGFEGTTLTAGGIPFSLPSKQPDLYCSTFEGCEELAVPLRTKASEVYLLLWAAFTGGEEQARGSGRLQKLIDGDRFRVRLEYADGSQSECLPLNRVTRRFEITAGPQVLCAFAEPTKQLRRVVLCDRTAQGLFGLAAVTCRTAGDRLCGEFAEELPALRIRPPSPARTPERAAARLASQHIELANTHLALTLEYAPLPRVVRLVNRATGHDALGGRAAEPLLALNAGALEPAGVPDIKESADRVVVECRYNVTQAPGVQAILRAELGAGSEVAIEVAFTNGGAQPVPLGFAGPTIGNLCLGDDLAGNYYLLPKCGAAFHNGPCQFHERYCGHDMPLQFISLVNPAAGEGLYLRTEDTNDTWRSYCLRKGEQGVSFGLDYPVEPLAPGATRHGSRTLLGVGGGDWREGFEAYRRWLQTWYRPAAPRQPWFREVFNFRQHFLWSNEPLYDRTTGELHLERALTEAQAQFGGLEYLHLFDWGNCGKFGRIYGRTGDYPPYDLIRGGEAALRSALAGVQAQGVRTGLYIEGYLLDERGLLGQAQGRAWQLVRANGERAYWPLSTEMFMCPSVSAWREVQASTYAARVRELGVDGMYVDEFGFANSAKDCYSREHGHAAPAYAVPAERDYMRLLRERVDATRPGVALYGEESPCDVNSQFQDGSFTYSMAMAARTATLAPLNLLRFALPDFKTFEILSCDHPTGSWASGVQWVFFNGEGLWLEGPATDWFAPATLAAIRKCHAILREHRDAFTSSAPVPLMPTEAGGVFANLFPAGGKRVFTFYNSRHRTFSGEVLRLPHAAGARYHDAWNGRDIQPRRDGSDDVLATTLEPLGVGCLVVTCTK
jgi:hypothetical protein